VRACVRACVRAQTLYCNDQLNIWPNLVTEQVVRLLKSASGN